MIVTITFFIIVYAIFNIVELIYLAKYIKEWKRGKLIAYLAILIFGLPITGIGFLIASSYPIK